MKCNDKSIVIIIYYYKLNNSSFKKIFLIKIKVSKIIYNFALKLNLCINIKYLITCNTHKQFLNIVICATKSKERVRCLQIKISNLRILCNYLKIIKSFISFFCSFNLKSFKYLILTLNKEIIPWFALLFPYVSTIVNLNVEPGWFTP